MKPFFALLKLSFISLLRTTMNSGSSSRRRKRSVSGAGALVLLGFLMVYVSGTYSFMLAGAFGPQGGLDLMLTIMLLLAMVFPFIITIYSAQGTVFSTKDTDLVLALPVSAFTVLLARVSSLYLEVLYMMELMLLPVGIAWAWFGGAGGVGFAVELLVMGLFLALIPTTMSMIFGYLISAVVSRMRFKNFFTVLFSLVLVGVIMVGSFMLPSTMTMAEANMEGVRQTLQGSLPPFYFAAGALASFSIPRLLLVAAVCVAPFFLLSWLFSLNYKKILTGLQSHAQRRNFKLRSVRTTGSFAALLGKEARRFFGTPAYVLNMGMMGFLVLAASVAALLFKSNVSAFLVEINEGMTNFSLSALLPIFVLGVLAFSVAVTCPSCVSMSLEGKTLWLLKSSPVSAGRVFLAKAGFGALVSAAFSVVPAILLGIAFDISAAQTVAIALVMLAFAAFEGMEGLMINLALPKMDAENETLVIKQSSSVIVSMLVCLGAALLTGGAFALAYLLAGGNFAVGCAGAGGALLLLSVGMFALLATVGKGLYRRL